MFSWITLRAYTIVQVIVLAGAQFSTETCVEAGHQRKSAELLCVNGSISNVNVQSGNGKCLEKDGRCLGLTPSLLVDQLNCYWRRNCLINWPTEPIVYAEDYHIGRTCIGRLPTFMSIRYKCFKPTDIQEDGGLFRLSESDTRPKRLLLDICSDLKDGKSLSQWSADPTMAGIIRSHKHFPWDYSNIRRDCSVKFFWTSGVMLVITIQTLDLSEDDHLTMEVGRGKLINVTGSGSYTFSNDGTSVINFVVGNESNGGKGFLICFRFTTHSDRSFRNVCDTLMTDGIVKNTEPVADDPFAFLIEKSSATTSAPIEYIPKRCLRRKTERSRQRCKVRLENRRRKKGDKNKTGVNRYRRRRGRKERTRRHNTRNRN